MPARPSSKSAPKSSRLAENSRPWGWEAATRMPRRAGAARKSAPGCSRLWTEAGLDALEHRIHVGIGVHDAQQPVGLVVLDQRLGLRLVHLETLADDLFFVVGTLDQPMRIPALRGVRERPRRGGIDVENPSANLADPAPGQALEQNAQVEVQEHHRVERSAEVPEHLFQPFRLSDGAGKAIQDEALGGV